ncbi:hypothetical protein C8J56DRAFT_883796 [Mycena floridula]|nr:hypothetical protein C8J56DRAFT_883796 [Mycena floridula]
MQHVPYEVTSCRENQLITQETETSGVQYNRVLLDTHLNDRVVGLHIQSGIGNLFWGFLLSKGLIEIHSSKLASVFKVDYFKASAFLAQSPQLAKQMAIAADFETKFMSLDLEMTIEEHYHEVRELLNTLFISIFRENYRKEIEVIRKHFSADQFKWREGPEGTLEMTFKEAIDLLVEDGVPRGYLGGVKFVSAFCINLGDAYRNFYSTDNKKRLGHIVRAKYEIDYLILDKSPMELRPFYTMPDANLVQFV